MENNKDYLSTFRFYNDKVERLSIFAKRIEDKDALEVVVIPCSKKDTFSKKEGRRRYEENDYKVSTKVIIPFEDGKSKKALLNFARNNYYYLKPVEVTVELLVKGENQDILCS